MNCYTFPSKEILDALYDHSPDYMYPSKAPYAFIAEGWLKDQECEDILKIFEHVPSYRMNHCNAITKELTQDMNDSLNLVQAVAEHANHEYWKFDIDHQPTSWLQTYTDGNDYTFHTDHCLGQTRKLTAVALLSNQEDYYGGELKVCAFPGRVMEFYIPKTRGTIVVFPGWTPHEVTLVGEGLRQTINMGFWGPAWK